MPNNEQDVFTIPKWFVTAVTVIVTLAVPWAVWSTNALITISVRLENYSDLGKKVDTLEVGIKENLIRIEHVERQVDRQWERIGKDHTKSEEKSEE